MSTQTYDLFCIGNPLLDIQVVKGESLLEKYKLKANDAVLASDEQLPMCVLALQSRSRSESERVQLRRHREEPRGHVRRWRCVAERGAWCGGECCHLS
jgi:hypothetical protein